MELAYVHDWVAFPTVQIQEMPVKLKLKGEVREHLISSQFFSKRNPFRNGGEGVALVSDGKSQIAHFRQKRKIDFEETFEVWIERKRPALSLLNPRSTGRGDRP